MSDYVKMSQLVGDIFTVTKVWGYNFKKHEAHKRLNIAGRLSCRLT